MYRDLRSGTAALQRVDVIQVLLVTRGPQPAAWVGSDGAPFHLSVASSLTEAAARLETLPVDVVVLDSHLAEDDAGALPRLRENLGHAGLLVRTDGYSPDVPVVLKSAGGAACLLPAGAPAPVQAQLIELAAERARLASELAERVEELEQSRFRFRDVIERNADAIVVVDPQGVIRFGNAMAAGLFRTRREDLPGTPFGFPVVLGETTELDLLHDGTPRVVEMRVVESEWEGEPAFIASLRDITERKQAEESARRLIREQEANQAKSDLLAVISHDLRTPLSAIIGYADLLGMEMGDEPGDRRAQWLERIQTAAGHVLYLIDELLSFARIEAGREEVRLQDIDARAVAREVAAVVEPLALERRLAFHLNVPRQRAAVRTDPDRLRQVLLNLVGNAIKYTEQGEVRLDLYEASDHIAIDVRDTGIGIRSEHLGKIFEPFWQVDPGRRSADGSTGLGLGVVRGLVRLLGGEVTVESEPGCGSTFTVRLPRRTAG
jgi:signal transduction histidine kinase